MVFICIAFEILYLFWFATYGCSILLYVSITSAAAGRSSYAYNCLIFIFTATPHFLLSLLYYHTWQLPATTFLTCF